MKKAELNATQQMQTTKTTHLSCKRLKQHDICHFLAHLTMKQGGWASSTAAGMEANHVEHGYL